MQANKNVAEMGTGTWSGRGSLKELVRELQRRKDSMLDFVADTRSMMLEEQQDMRLVARGMHLRELLPDEGLPILPQAMQQMCERSSPPVPWKFWQELQRDKSLTAANLMNDLLTDGGRRFVRCLDGKVRAVLSNSYRVIDNYDMAFTALDVVRESGGEVVEAALSDKFMRIKFTSRQIFDTINEARQGDKSTWYTGGLGNQQYLFQVAAKTQGELPGGPGTVHPLVTISNSETGHGGFNVRIGILRAICFNLATVETVATKVHLGERMEAGIFRPETLSADSKAIVMKCQDAIRAAFNQEHFKRIVALANMAQSQVIHNPQNALGNLVELGLPEKSKDDILRYFYGDHDQTAYGLAQAVARYSQDVSDADASSDLEELAGSVIRQPELVLT